MKKFAVLLLAMFTLSNVYCQTTQKYAYIYSEEVFKTIPEYGTATTKLNEYIKEVEKQAEKKFEDVKVQYQDFLSKESQLTSTMREYQKKALIDMERDATEFQKSLYTDEGLIKKKQIELFKPIEDKVLNAINRIVANKKYDMIFDLSIAKVTVYQSPSLNITNEVINTVKGL